MFPFPLFHRECQLGGREPERLWAPLCPSLCTGLNLELTAPVQADARAAGMSQEVKKPKSHHSTSQNTAELEREKIRKLNSQGTQGISRVPRRDVRRTAETLPRGIAEPGGETRGEERRQEQGNKHCCKRNPCLTSNFQTCSLQFFPIKFLQKLYNWLG